MTAKKKVSKKITTKKSIRNSTKASKASVAEALTPEIVLDDDAPEQSELATNVTGALTSTDPLSLYMAEIRKYKLLSPEEEKKLAIEYFETKSPQAAEKLITSNLRFVVSVAAEYAKFGARMIDLIQEGNIGLMHAVREFNPYKGNKLITYAVWWIRGYIREYLLKQYSLVKIGTTQEQKKLFYQLQKEQSKLESIGLEPTTALLSSRMGVSEDAVKDMRQRMSGRDVSLDRPIDEDGGRLVIDIQRNPDEIAPDDELAHAEELEILKTNMKEIEKSLNEKELAILQNRILADEPLTLQEIGDKFGITRERARQLEERVLLKIKELIQPKLVKN